MDHLHHHVVLCKVNIEQLEISTGYETLLYAEHRELLDNARAYFFPQHLLQEHHKSSQVI